MSVTNDILTHPAYIRKLREAGGQAQQAARTDAPPVDAGLFDYPVWEPGKAYALGELFAYGGQPGFVRQAHTSQAEHVPFAVGTESLYGARPRQRPDGVYPYVYNMRAEPGMRVASAKDGAAYTCIQAADPLLYDPAGVPAIFEKEEKQ